MGIFGNKSKADEPLGSLFADDDFQPVGVDYNSALDWLTGLSDDDYKKVCTVAEIYRKAEKDAAEALGVESVPTTFITPPQPEEIPVTTLLDDDEDGDIAAILDEAEAIEKQVDNRKAKQIQVDEK